MTDFVHLHLHTEYSLLDGACKVEDLVEYCKKNGIDTICCTDHGNMYATLYFAEEAVQHGLKYIIGCEFYVCDDMNVKDSTSSETDHLILIAKNVTGYKNLVKLDSMAYVDGFYYKPRIDYKVLKEHTEGVICLSACLAGRLPKLLLRGEDKKAKEFALYLKELYGEDFYIEIQDHGIPEEKEIIPKLIRLANEIGVELVATNDVHYLKKEDWEAQDVLMCIQMKKTLDDPKRMKFSTHEFYFKSGDEMAELFSYVPKAISNTRVIADKVTEGVFPLDKKGYPIRDMSLIPGYQPDDGTDPATFLTNLTYNGLKKRYPVITDEIKKRVEYELGIIISMGFAEYYLIVWDFINWSKEHNIPVGPGRGSGVSSIVAYSTGITDVDPLKYDLVFERFLNPDRVSMPDFDVDFCTENRYKTIEYVRNKYHPENVAQIVTFGTLASKAAIKDIGRVMRVPYSETDKVAKIMDGKSSIKELLGMKIEPLMKKIAEETDEDKKGELVKSLEEQKLKRNQEFIDFYENDETLHRVIDMAIRLEGMPRNTSMHAAGVVICRKPIADNVPLSRNGEDITTQFDMKEIESLGMLKMDFLALATLTDIQKAVDYIYEDTGIKLDFNEIGVENQEAYELIGAGDTDGVFQLEQGGMKKFMRDLKPDCLEDLIAGISLYRPGPMQYIGKYCANKRNPQNITYDTPLLEPILKSSYGVLIYQEQVMRVFQDLAGFSLGQADLVRRAMGKKDKKTLMAQKERFIAGDIAQGGTIEGCEARGVSREIASKIFSEMEAFASYAFNKSHAAAYAVLSYRTAYLKRFYPKEFLAAILNNRITKIEEISKYIVYMKEKNIKVLPPDINKSKAYFSVSVEDNGVRFGICALKGVGIGAIEQVMEERKKSPFADFPDFVQRCAPFINKRIVESLIYAGAFDSMGVKRSQLEAVYEQVLARANAISKQKQSAQMSLFGDILEEEKIDVNYPDIPEFELNVKLSKEKEVLGVYVTGHPIEKYMHKFHDCNFNCSLLQDYEEDEDGNKTYNSIVNGQPVTMGGIVSATKRVQTRSGTFMCFVSVEDVYGCIECVAFPAIYERCKGNVLIDKIVRIRGKLDVNPDKAPVIIADDISEITDNPAPSAQGEAKKGETETKRQTLWLDARTIDDEDFDELVSMLEMYEGDLLCILVRGDKKYKFDGVKYCRGLMAELSTLLEPKQIKLVN